MRFRVGLIRRGWVDDMDDTPLRLPLLDRRCPARGFLVRFCYNLGPVRIVDWRERDVFRLLALVDVGFLREGVSELEVIDMASASLSAHGFRYDFDCVDPNLVSQPNATPALPIAWQNVPREQSDSRRWFRALYEWDARLRVVRRRLQERSFDDIPGNESR